MCEEEWLLWKSVMVRHVEYYDENGNYCKQHDV